MSLLQRSKLKFKPNIGAATAAPTASVAAPQPSASVQSEPTPAPAPQSVPASVAPASFTTVSNDVFLRPATPVRPSTPRVDASSVTSVELDAAGRQQNVTTQAREAERQVSETNLVAEAESIRSEACVKATLVETSVNSVESNVVTVSLEGVETVVERHGETIAIVASNGDSRPTKQVSTMSYDDASLAPQCVEDAEPATVVANQRIIGGISTPSVVHFVPIHTVTTSTIPIDGKVTIESARFSKQKFSDDTASNASSTKRRRSSKEKAEVVEPDYSTMRMADFVRYNPTHKPAMSWKKRGKGSSRNGATLNSTLASPSKLEAIEDKVAHPELETGGQELGSMLRIGADGKLEINQEALTVVRRDPASDPTLPVVTLDPTQRSGVYRFARRRTYSQRWSADETLLFYKALYLVGSDFSAMEQLGCFRNRRDRRMLKNKFKKEERESCDLVHDAISRRVRVDESDPATFQQFLARLRLDLSVAINLDDEDGSSDLSQADSNANAACNASVSQNSRKKRQLNSATAKTKIEGPQEDLASLPGDLEVDSDVESTQTDASWKKRPEQQTSSPIATRAMPSRRTKLVAQQRFAEFALITRPHATASSSNTTVTQSTSTLQPLPSIETLRRGTTH